MAKYKIEHDLDKCIGCGVCVSLCPENWVMKGGKSYPKKTELDDLGCNKEAADACPTQAIKIKKLKS